MPVFRSIVFSAALAGLIVGAVISVAQFFGTVPLIQQSEVYERKAAAEAPPAAHDHDKAHSHDSEWEPEDGLQRNSFTVAANILTAIGFALLLTGTYAIRGRPVTWREGLLWGLAGFVVFTAAPGLGLPPELPGMAVAELTARQTWWIATAVATAGGLFLLAFRPAAWAAVLGLGLIALPHLIGAPLAPESHSEVPAALSHRFIVVVTLTSLLFWTLLGVATSIAFGRIARPQP
jgi:cobalt transporter subunit CbtA